MCIEATIPDGRRIKTIGELRECVPAVPVLYKQFKETPPDDMCLCPVDLGKTVEPLGWRVDVDDDGEIFIVIVSAEPRCGFHNERRVRCSLPSGHNGDCEFS